MHLTIIVTALSGVLVALNSFAAPEPIGRKPPARHVEGELLVKFRGGPNSPDARAIGAQMRHTVKHTFARFGWQHIRLPEGVTVEEALPRYRNLPGVVAVVPNGMLPALDASGSDAGLPPSTLPNDPGLAEQYGLAKIAASNAWNISTGSSNVVAVVMDSGINYRHEDLAANIWRNPGEIAGNGLDDDGNGHVDDIHGVDVAEDFYGNDSDPNDEGIRTPSIYHGSIIGGIIGAAANNRVGMAGVNWSVQLMAVRSARTNGFFYDSDRFRAYEYISEMKERGVNIRVLNMSFGGTNGLPETNELQQLADMGLLLVAAAGNSSLNTDVTPAYPAAANIDAMISVAASDQADALADFSNYGRTNVDLAAPGVGISSTFGPTTNAYGSGNGTSYSAPYVVGAAALLFAAYPFATSLEVKAALLDSVDVLPAFTNRMVSNGRLNVGRALQLLGSRLTNAPPNITFQPEGQTIVVSNGFGFRAVATGTQPLDSQWWRNGSAVSGATNLTYQKLAAAEEDAGEYTLVVSNAFGAVTSAVARLTVLTTPLFVAHPQNRAAPETSNVTFTAIAHGYLPQYHWQFLGTNLPGRTGTNLVLTNIFPALGGQYSVVASNAYGMATSAVATLTVWTFPRIVEPAEPVRISVVRGGSVTLSVRTTGSLPIGYRWRRSGLGVVLTNMVLHENQSFLTLVPTNSGTYTLLLTNIAQPFSSPTRTNAIVTVLEDTDGDGLPDTWESEFASAAEPDGDADGDGLTNLEEYRAGTNPTNAASMLRIESLTREGTSTRLTFTAASNKTYAIEQRPLVETGAWTRVLNVVAAGANRQIEVVRTNDMAHPRGFYRVRTPVP